MKEKLHQGITLVVDRYAFSGVAFTSAKEVRPTAAPALPVLGEGGLTEMLVCLAQTLPLSNGGMRVSAQAENHRIGLVGKYLQDHPAQPFSISAAWFSGKCCRPWQGSWKRP